MTDDTKRFQVLPDRRALELNYLAREARGRQEAIRRSVQAIQDKCQDIRIWLQAALHDLESTRRENEELKRRLLRDSEDTDLGPLD